MGRLRILVYGADAAHLRAVAAGLAGTPGADRRDVVVVGSLEPRSLQRLVSEANAPQVAIVLADAQHVRTAEIRTWLHLLLTVGLDRALVALDNIELVDDGEAVFARVQGACADVAATLRATPVVCVPMSATSGDNLAPTAHIAWYRGPTLLDCLERLSDAEPESDQASQRMKPELADQFEASIVWTGDRPMLQSRSYLMRLGDASVWATVAPLKYKIDASSLQRTPAKTLASGDLGVCNLQLGAPIAFEGGSRRFVLVDQLGRETAGLGLLHFALRRSQNLQWQALDINKERRAVLMGQKPCVIWFTGLSGAGKSTIANLVEKRLHAIGRHTYLLDGDNVRHGLNKDLGFTDADRVENIRRVAEVARLMVDAGLVVLVSFISPFRSERRMARALLEEGEFVEVFVDTPLGVAESRDPKGLYSKARRGELRNFTGVDSPYEVPEYADVRLDTTRLSAEQSAELILEHLERAGIVWRRPAPLSPEKLED
jgi:bifunctional enzyme CysN/CysC